MIKFLTITLVLMTLSCGSDTSDSEGNETYVAPSSDANETYVAPSSDANTDVEVPSFEPVEEDPLVCVEGKLCPGMTREDVLALLGEPIKILDYGFAHQHWWIYDNDDQGVDYCQSLLDCRLRFDRSGILQEQVDVALKYLDILRWNK